MAMSQLFGRQSLRDIQSNLEAQQHKLYHLGAKPIARSTLARLNDASAIDLSLSVFPWATHHDDTANVKLSVGLNHGTHIPEFVALSDGQENDMIEGREFDFPKGSILNFDKGYADYQWFKSLTDKGVFFVTRLRAKAVYRVEERRYTESSKGVLSDQVIQLSSSHTIKRDEPKLRRIGYRDAECSSKRSNKT